MRWMKRLLTVLAVIEGGTGLILATFPSLVSALLLGASLDTLGALTVTRVAGVALLALAMACWRARHDGQSHAARGVVGAMVLYNAGVLTILVYAGIGLGQSGIGLWPAVLVHGAMVVWCIKQLRVQTEPFDAGGHTRSR
jgi:hypothetical protein